MKFLMTTKNSIMKYKLVVIILVTLLIFQGCGEGNSVFDPDFELPGNRPIVTNITPDPEYLAGVDSVIVTGENFSDNIDEVVINFGGSEGVILSASPTQLIVRPGQKDGQNLPVKVGVFNAEFLSEAYSYTLRPPQGLYPGTSTGFVPVTPLGIDGNNNVYLFAERNSAFRLYKIAVDGTTEIDGIRNLGEFKEDGETPVPADSTLRYPANSYSDIEIGPMDQVFMTQGSVRAIFIKTFGDGIRESLWVASSSAALKIQDMIFDDNGFLWVVGRDSDQIHRFNSTTKAESKFPFVGQFNAVAYYKQSNELFVSGTINGSQQVWKFSIDGSGNLGSGELYFDFGAKYDGNITSLILASNGELLIGNTGETSIVRVFPSGRNQAFYPGMIKQGTFSITWRDDEFAVVATEGDGGSLNFMDMFDRTRSGIFGFN